jgi:hypothetical protein
MPRANNNKSNDLFISLVNVIMVITIIAVIVAGVLRFVDHFRPRPGEIISFDLAKSISPDTEPRMEVMPAGIASANSCYLDVRTMRSSGGSLVIEAIQPGPSITYRVHWAGGPTSDGRTSCGESVELLLNHAQFIALKLAAWR